MNLDILPIGDEIQNKNQLSDSTNSFFGRDEVGKELHGTWQFFRLYLTQFSSNREEVQPSESCRVMSSSCSWAVL